MLSEEGEIDFLLKLLLKPAIYKPLTKIVAKGYDKAEQEVKKVVEKVKKSKENK